MSYSVIEKGSAQQKTIAQANVAQTLVSEQTLVSSVQVVPDGGNSGDVKIGYCSAPLLPQLALTARTGKFIDLALIQIQSTVQGDKVNFLCIYNI